MSGVSTFVGESPMRYAASTVCGVTSSRAKVGTNTGAKMAHFGTTPGRMKFSTTITRIIARSNSRVQGRTEGADPEAPGADRHQAAGHPALGRQADAQQPLAREVVPAAGHHHREHLRRDRLVHPPGTGDRAAPAVAHTRLRSPVLRSERS